jgi:hypothetical protein
MDKGRKKLVTWYKRMKEIIHASCDVDDERSMWEIALQDLKGSAGSDVKSNTIHINGNNDMHANADV